MKKVIFSLTFAMLMSFGTTSFAFTGDSFSDIVENFTDKDKDKKKKKKDCCDKKNKEECKKKAEKPKCCKDKAEKKDCHKE